MLKLCILIALVLMAGTTVAVSELVSGIHEVFGKDTKEVPKCKIPMEELIKSQDISKC